MPNTPFNDITKLLRTWQYEPSTLNVRILEAEDGRELIQLRIELGVIQMEMNGRPDGVVQDGYPSLLALLEERGAHGGGETAGPHLLQVVHHHTTG